MENHTKEYYVNELSAALEKGCYALDQKFYTLRLTCRDDEGARRVAHAGIAILPEVAKKFGGAGAQGFYYTLLLAFDQKQNYGLAEAGIDLFPVVAKGKIYDVCTLFSYVLKACGKNAVQKHRLITAGIAFLPFLAKHYSSGVPNLFDALLEACGKNAVQKHALAAAGIKILPGLVENNSQEALLLFESTLKACDKGQKPLLADVGIAIFPGVIKQYSNGADDLFNALLKACGKDALRLRNAVSAGAKILPFLAVDDFDKSREVFFAMLRTCAKDQKPGVLEAGVQAAFSIVTNKPGCFDHVPHANFFLDWVANSCGKKKDELAHLAGTLPDGTRMIISAPNGEKKRLSFAHYAPGVEKEITLTIRLMQETPDKFLLGSPVVGPASSTEQKLYGPFIETAREVLFGPNPLPPIVGFVRQKLFPAPAPSSVTA